MDLVDLLKENKYDIWTYVELEFSQLSGYFRALGGRDYISDKSYKKHREEFYNRCFRFLKKFESKKVLDIFYPTLYKYLDSTQPHFKPRIKRLLEFDLPEVEFGLHFDRIDINNLFEELLKNLLNAQELKVREINSTTLREAIPIYIKLEYDEIAVRDGYATISTPLLYTTEKSLKKFLKNLTYKRVIHVGLNE